VKEYVIYSMLLLVNIGEHYLIYCKTPLVMNFGQKFIFIHQNLVFKSLY